MSRFLAFEGMCITLTLCIVSAVAATGNDWPILGLFPGAAFIAWIMAATE